MDLYADLPAAKGDANAEGGGNTSSGSSLWAKGVPAFVPSAALSKRNAPSVNTKMAMLPASMAGSRRKSPDAATAAQKTGISLAFRPASVTRKAPPATSNTTPTGLGFKPSGSNAPSSVRKPDISDHTAPVATVLGFVAATTWTQVTVSQPADPTASETATLAPSSDATASSHFFQASYRDEYHPSRPNSYEAFREERAAKQKMEQVKRDLERRQRDQDRESKRDREQLVKDVNAGKAPSMGMQLSAGRGRGMTVPAWMKKKIEESASHAAPRREDVNVDVDMDQFEDAAPRVGLGFGGGDSDTKSTRSRRDEFGRDISSGDPVGRGNDQPSRDHYRRSPVLTPRDGSSHQRSHNQNRENTEGSLDRQPSSSSRRQELASTARSDVTGSQRQHGLEPRATRVVLLQNMVGPGEVDDELQEEVKEECSSKYGPVSKCVVYELQGRVNPEEAVRIFVEFQHQAHADLAQKGLNSRFFGGRRVKATYYDEAKFARLDLGP